MTGQDTRRARIAAYVRHRSGAGRRRLHRPRGPDRRHTREAAPASPPQPGGPRVINLVSRDNGVGLSVDMDLLEGIFSAAGHDVRRVDWTSRDMRRCHVAFFLELVNPRLFRHAHATVGILNLEWFQSRWRVHLPRFRQLWAKSAEAHTQLSRLGLPSLHTGFATRDLHDPAVPRGTGCLHLKGHSGTKNTHAVLEAWARHRDLPPLTVVSQTPVDAPAGVTVLPRVSDTELRRLLNRHPIHLCPSRTEGWGHYITEALTVGALVVTTDASPMNEHVRPEWGYLLRPTASRPRHMAREHDVDPDQLAAAVREAAALPPRQRNRMSQAARAHALARNDAFRRVALTLLEEL